MRECRSVVSPGVKDEKERDVASGATAYRRAVARLNYLAQDRADISYATKELACNISGPKTCDVLRFLKSHLRCCVLFAWQKMPECMTRFVDSDWAGCVKTRRSTS